MATPNPALVDIKDEVAQRLEDNGALDKIRVQIRANVYCALLAANGDASRTTSDGGEERRALARPISVVADFLQRLGLEMTREVFLKESQEHPFDRHELAKDLGCMDRVDFDNALLEHVVSKARTKGFTSDVELKFSVPPTIEE